MILIVGGAYQGKKRILNDLLESNAETKGTVITDFHQTLREVLKRGEDTDAYTRQVIASEPLGITMDEVGYGIVPMDPKEREYREAVGRAGQMLAACAKEVYRVICGIPQKIK